MCVEQEMSSTSSSNEPIITLLASILLSCLAYKLTSTLVPLLGQDLIEKGLGGVDMLKPGFIRSIEGEKVKPVQTGKIL